MFLETRRRGKAFFKMRSVARTDPLLSGIEKYILNLICPACSICIQIYADFSLDVNHLMLAFERLSAIVRRCLLSFRSLLKLALGIGNLSGYLNQCLGSGFIDSGSGSGILGWMPIRIRGFNDQKWKKFTAERKIWYFCDQRLQLVSWYVGIKITCVVQYRIYYN